VARFFGSHLQGVSDPRVIPTHPREDMAQRHSSPKNVSIALSISRSTGFTRRGWADAWEKCQFEVKECAAAAAISRRRMPARHPSRRVAAAARWMYGRVSAADFYVTIMTSPSAFFAMSGTRHPSAG
jgi:hypothetical protein